MKLNHHAKELRDTLEALDFRFDERESQRRGGGHYYHHHADPDQYIKVFGRISPMAARTAMDKARQIAGLATVGKPASAQIKDIAREKREQAKARQAAEAAERERRADQLGLVKAAERERRRRQAELASISSLMRPGYGR